MPRRVAPRGPRLWPWLIGVVALLLAIWGVRLLMDQNQQFDDPSELTTEAPDVPDPVVVPAPADE